MSKTFAIVIPVFNNKETIRRLVKEIRETFSDFNDDLEIILVDDKSTDQSQQVIESLSKSDPQIVGILLPKNVGRSKAVVAGLKYCTKSELVGIMDADLDHPPSVMKALFNHIMKSKFDYVYSYENEGGNQSRLSSRFFEALTKTGWLPIWKPLRLVVVNANLRNWLCRNHKGNHFAYSLLHSGFQGVGYSYALPKRNSSVTSTKRRRLLFYDYVTTYFSLNFVSLVAFLFSLLFLFALFASYIVLEYSKNSTLPGWTSTVMIVSFTSLLNLTLTTLVGLSILAQIRRNAQEDLVDSVILKSESKK